MDETKIAAQVAQKIPSEPAVTVQVDTPQDEGDTGYVKHMDSEQFNTFLEDYFNVSARDRYNDDVKNMLSNVQHWAYETAGTKSYDKAMLAIHSLESEIGATHKPDRVQRVAKFIQLKRQSDVLKMQMDAVKDNYDFQ